MSLPGLERSPRFDLDLGIDRLEVVKISRQSAEQRKGRAGREGPGSCYRLWSEVAYDGWAESTAPEISRVGLFIWSLDGWLPPRPVSLPSRACMYA